jgi:AcrR family transcriptional regulator
MQVLKPELRVRALEAAEAEFAEAGYRGATMANIAARAGMSTGNLYRYFRNKDALFETLFPASFANELLRLLRKRVGSLVDAEDLTDLGAPAQEDAGALLDFWIANRLKVIVLLDRAEGSVHEDFRRRFVDALIQPSLKKLRAEAGGRRVGGPARLVIETLFDNTVRMVVAILESDDDPEAIAAAFAGFWSYQLAGLAGFTRWVAS